VRERIRSFAVVLQQMGKKTIKNENLEPDELAEEEGKDTSDGKNSVEQVPPCIVTKRCKDCGKCCY